MNNPNRHWPSLAIAAALCAGAAMFVCGCDNSSNAPVVAAPPPPPPPPPAAPKVTPIADLMAQLNIDPRVSLPEDKAPETDADRKAVLVFFDTFARGNSQALKSMLPLADQPQLTALVNSGAWKTTTSGITKIAIQTGLTTGDLKCALAVIEVGKGAETSYQPQLWYYTSEGENDTIEAAPTPPGIMDRLTGDWIVTWHKILDEEKALALKPDESVQIEQKNLDNSNASDPQTASTGGGGGGGGGAPSTPGGLRPGGGSPVSPGGPPPPGNK